MFQCSSRADMEDWYRDIYHYHSGQRGSISSTSGSLHGAVPNTGEIYEGVCVCVGWGGGAMREGGR